MKLYHGSISLFQTVDVNKGKGYKDFGQGFYTTSVKHHATRLARRNKEIELARLLRLNKPVNVQAYLYVFEFDMKCLKHFNTKTFHSADREWAQFVLVNRSSKTKTHVYDYVMGPTADDNIKASLGAFQAGIYGNPDHPKSIDTLISHLITDHLPNQYYFGSNKITQHLKLKEVNPL
jgi:hypothetical protein